MRTIKANVTASWDDLTEDEQSTLVALIRGNVSRVLGGALYSLRAKGLVAEQPWISPNPAYAGLPVTMATPAGRALVEAAVSAPDAILGPEERTDAREPVGTAKSPVTRGEA